MSPKLLILTMFSPKLPKIESTSFYEYASPQLFSTLAAEDTEYNFSFSFLKPQSHA
jgi:hypothetical protein